MTQPEPTYTLAEAKQLLRDQECGLRRQHQLSPVPGDIGRVSCVSCTRTFLLVPE